MKSNETIRKQAQTEIKNSFWESGLSTGNNDLDERIPTPIRLSTTKEELEVFLFESSLVRPEFILDKSILQIPVFFVKLNNNSQEFIAKIREQYRLNPNNALMFSGFHILKREVISADSISEILVSPDRKINGVLANQFEEINSLKTGKKQYLYAAIEQIIATKDDIAEIAEMSDSEILLTCIKQNEKVLKIFNESVYDKTPPKCIIIDSNKSNLNREAIVRLLLMHFLSFDIIVASYKSYSSIENYFPESYFDKHEYSHSSKNYAVTKEKKSFLPFFLWAGFALLIIYVVLHWGLDLI